VAVVSACTTRPVRVVGCALLDLLILSRRVVWIACLSAACSSRVPCEGEEMACRRLHPALLLILLAVVVVGTVGGSPGGLSRDDFPPRDQVSARLFDFDRVETIRTGTPVARVARLDDPNLWINSARGMVWRASLA
jgi:hypothetical protein